MLKRYRASASYGSLNNRCLPYTSAITDNSKFNLEMIADIYINNIQETAENHTAISNKNKKTKEGKKDDDNSKGKKQSTCQSAECSTCGV